MVKFINRIPAGNFLVPMIVAAIFYTIFPNLFAIGGPTQAAFSDAGVNFIVGAICFCSGIGIDLRRIGPLLKRHGVILISKFVLAVGLSFLYMGLFGQEGILGISALAFTVAICSINPAVYISLVDDFGTEDDPAAFGLTGLFSIPAVPIIIYGITGSGGFDIMPVFSTVLPIGMGMLLGNLDRNFTKMFGGGIGILIPFLGWNIGQSINLIEAAQSGLFGIVLAVVYYIFMAPLFALDYKGLKNDGVVSLSMTAVAGLSASTPAVIAQTTPAVEPFVTSATAQVLTVVVITSILSPILVRQQYRKVYGEEALYEIQELHKE